MMEEKYLDEEFRQLISDMKPHTKVLPYKSEERHRVTLWIKKLLALKTQKRERNAYAKQLLMMLKSGKLKEPFTLSPPLGPLRPRPPGLLHVGGETETLMSSSPPNTFLKPPKSVSSRPSSLLSTHRPGGGPHQFSPLRPISPQDPVSSSSSANKTTARQLEEDENLFSLPEEISCPIVATAPRGGGSDLSSSPLEWKFHPSLTSSVKGEGDGHSVGVVLSPEGADEESVEYRPLSVCSEESFPNLEALLQATPRPHPLPPSSNAPSSGSGVKLTSEILQQREMELLLRSTETHHQEEKLRLQREYEESIQQLLSRRTEELEEARQEGKYQLQLLQSQNQQLETTVAGLQRELEERRKIDSKSVQHQNHKLQAEFDKKLHKTITDFERQKLDQEQRHAKHIQQVVGDCGRRIGQMERDCASQLSTSTAIVAELEGRVQELTEQNSTLESAKESQDRRIQSLEHNLQESRKSLDEVRDRVSALQQERETERRQTEARMEAKLREKTEQHSLEENRLLKEINELEGQVKEWQRRHEEAGEGHHREMEEMRRSTTELQSSLRLAQTRLSRMRTAQERQSQEAEVAIEHFKAQVELQSNEVFSSLHGEVERLAAELTECRAERDSNVLQCAQERREERERVNSQLQAIEAGHQQEKEELLSQFNTQLDSQRKKMEREKKQEVSQLQQKISELLAQTKATTSRSAKTVTSLEEKTYQLQQELESTKSRHSRDTARLRKKLEEEKQTATKMTESAVLAVKVEWQEEMKRLKMTHQRELNTTKDKHNQFLQEMELKLATESRKSAETIGSLQAQLELLTTDLVRHKEQIAVAKKVNEEERLDLVHHHELMLQSVREEADASQQIVSQLQAKLSQLKQEHEHKLSTLRLKFQTKLNGMMPMAMRKEYDNTIQSLRSQVEMLEQRMILLLQELERLRPVLLSHSPGHNPTHGHTPITTS